MLRRLAVIGFICVLQPFPTPAQAQRHYSALGPDIVELYDSLGTHHYHISTSRPRAQDYFDQGLRLLWALDARAARRSFQEATRIDPRCAMCAWGVALAISAEPGGMDTRSGRLEARRAIARAQALRRHANDREQALVAALAARHATGTSAAAGDTVWALRLSALSAQYPDDAEIRVLEADALLRMAAAGAGASPSRPEAVRELVAGVLATDAAHPGACHILAHLGAPAADAPPSCTARVPWLWSGMHHRECLLVWGAPMHPPSPSEAPAPAVANRRSTGRS